MINTVVLMGRLVAAPELRQTTNGTSVTAFTLAVDRKFSKDKTVDWIDCVAWQNTAEFICKYFGKGSMIALTGSIQTRTYEDKNGNKRKAVEVVADGASFCGAKKDSAEQNIRAAAGLDISADDDFTEIPTSDELPF